MMIHKKLPHLPENVSAWGFDWMSDKKDKKSEVHGIHVGLYTKPTRKKLAGTSWSVACLSEDDGELVCEVYMQRLKKHGGKLVVKNLPSGLVDLDGREICVGDKIKFIHADPLGRPTDELSDSVYEVVFQQGCFVAKYLSGGGVEAMNPKLLRNYMETKEGRYVSNVGNLTEYPNNKVFCRITEPFIDDHDDDGN
jgi:hypothetical protein